MSTVYLVTATGCAKCVVKLGTFVFGYMDHAISVMNIFLCVILFKSCKLVEFHSSRVKKHPKSHKTAIFV